MPSYRAAIKVSRRELLRFPKAFLAGLLLIALPVAILTGYSLREHSLTEVLDPVRAAAPQEEITAEYVGGTCTQTLDATFECRMADGTVIDRHDLSETDIPSLATVEAALGPDFTVQAVVNTSAQLEFRGEQVNGGLLQTPASFISPAANISLQQDEIMLPKSLAKQLGVSVGDRIQVSSRGLTRSLTVVKLSPQRQAVVAAGSFFDLEHSAPYDPTFSVQWHIHSARPLTWEDIERANAHGAIVQSRSFIDTPPEGTPAEVREDAESWTSYSGSSQWHKVLDAIETAIVYFVAVLSILLFISPVFALTLTRNTRVFALLASQGATRRHLRAAVFFNAGLIGVIGSSLGTVAGLAAGWAWWNYDAPGWSPTVPWGWTATIWGTAILAALGAAAVPAVLSARKALAQSLAGAQPDRILAWKHWMGVGPGVLAVSILGSYGVWLAQPEFLHHPRMEDLLMPLLLLALVGGTAASTPALIVAVSWLCQRGPLALRVAGRSLTRQSLRSIPAAAAVAALAAVCMFADTASSTANAHQAAWNQAFSPNNLAVVHGEDASAIPTVVNQLRNDYGNITTTDIVSVKNLNGYYAGGDSAAREVMLTFPEAIDCAQGRRYSTDPYDDSIIHPNGADAREDAAAARDCLGSFNQEPQFPALAHNAIVPIVDSSTMDQVLDLYTFASPEDRAKAAETLRAGGVLVSRGAGLNHLDNATLQAGFYDDGVDYYAAEDTPDRTSTAQVPIAPVLSVGTADALILSAPAAKELGLESQRVATVVHFPTDIGPHLANKLTKAVPEDINLSISVPWFPLGALPELIAPVAGIGVLCTFALIIALSAAAVRRESGVFHQLGATEGFTARVAALTYGGIAAAALWCGLLVGAAFGFLTTARDSYTVAGDLYQLGTAAFFRCSWGMAVLALTMPLLCAGLAWWVHRPQGSAYAARGESSGSRGLV
ncbi:FtsX-like permease family protein [Corynebacterium lizhenjunii]|uniref:FtsX-like permease family protein n=1 Tax=Corynebacterium lizhenjunii TaxID=2709394 RepID=A0A7T0KG44_9CORY|nr:FtsX-like permease family protein [Corynebacterium lizhenjunii]QPK79781.1 FtsX-like permease family protein [Corynebacterium lizhenjunii]